MTIPDEEAKRIERLKEASSELQELLAKISKKYKEPGIENEVVFKITDFSWGRHCNLFVHCEEIENGNMFEFSVFNNNRYCSRDGVLSFKEVKDSFEKNPNIIVAARFSKSKNGYLNCISARLLDNIEAQK